MKSDFNQRPLTCARGTPAGGAPDGVGDCFEQVALQSRTVNLPCLWKIGQSRAAVQNTRGDTLP